MSINKSFNGRFRSRLIRGRSPYSYFDSAVQPSTTYFYKLGAVDTGGQEVLYDPVSATTPPWGTRTELRLASPTPFRTETLLNFTLAAPTRARLAVVDEDLPEGDHTATWDGRDRGGLQVAGGTYFVKLTAGQVTQTRKVVFFGRQ